MTEKNRPEVILYMLESLDGRATGNFLEVKESEVAVFEYFQREKLYNIDGFITGNTTCKSFFKPDEKIDLTSFKDNKVNREDFVSPHKNDIKVFNFCIDRKGTLPFKKPNEICFKDYGRIIESHNVEILTDLAKDDYIAYLKSIGVSYIFAGKEQIDLKLMLQKIKELFGVKKLLLEGGPTINASFVDEDLVDGIVLYKCAVSSDGMAKTALGDSKKMLHCSLVKHELLKDNLTLVLEYKVNH